MGGAKYWQRRLVLDKFDDWKEWGARKRHYPWHWNFDELKQRKRNTIKTPEQAFKALVAILEYLKSELAKDPHWRPSEEMMPGLIRIGTFLEEVYPTIEDRYLQLKRNKATEAPAVQVPV